MLGAVRSRPSAAQARAIWSKFYGRPVPTDPETGRFQVMHHKTAVADDGDPWDPENLDPMIAKDHIDLHRANGDSARWGRLGQLAKTFAEALSDALPSIFGKPEELSGPLLPSIYPKSPAPGLPNLNEAYQLNRLSLSSL
jgi:hypothetical protein